MTPRPNYIVGCGGIGAWLAHVLVRQLNPVEHMLILLDGDEVEEKNLNRQFFSAEDIGSAKTAALAARLTALEPAMTVEQDPKYLTDGAELPEGSNLFVCVDNHPARAMCLDIADRCGVNCYISGNEYYEAEAFLYLPQWKNTALDPRIYYPDILTDEAGDPRYPATCTGEAQVSAPQLAAANMSAANYLMTLFTWWTQQATDQEYPLDTQVHWPVHLQLASGKPRSWSVLDKAEQLHNRTGFEGEMPPIAMPA
jgi:hypothetical protein